VIARSRFVAAACAAALALSCGPAAHAPAHGTRWFGATAPPAGDVLRFDLGTDPETIDPALATGRADGRICHVLFEGLTRDDPQTLEPRPGQAERWEVSADGLTYTFHLRPGLTWSDGTPLHAEDFRWSWVRVLRPATASRNAGLLAPIAGADSFVAGTLNDEHALGIAAPDDSTFVVRLRAPTPYFLSLAGYNPFLPVPRHAIERWGDRWTDAGKLVANGAFTLRHYRQNEKFVFDRNPRYWDAATVRLASVVAYTADAMQTSANLYKAGMVDWDPGGNLPTAFVPLLKGYADYRQSKYQGLGFYSMNVTRKPLDNVWLRRALAWSVDRNSIANDLLKGVNDGWGNFTPAGYTTYHAPKPIGYDPAYARECLAKAGYPGGRGLRKLRLLFRTGEDMRRMGEAVQSMWKRNLGVDIELENVEWGTYMKRAIGLDYDIAARSWIADYLDPNTFLACYVTGDGNNRTGWSDPRYDALIHRAAFEGDVTRRMALLHDAETLLLADGPVIPVYHYTTSELVKPYVRGLYPTALDLHPLTHVWIDHAWREGGATAER